MRYRLITFAALMALIFTACNNTSSKKSEITIPHQTFTIEHPLAENAEGLDFEANIQLPVSDNDVDSKIRYSLLNKVCGNYYNGDTNVERAIENYYQKHTETWKLSYENAKDSGMAINNWEADKEIKPIAQLGQMICYQSTHYYYEGGAHGLTNTTYHVFDLNNAQELNDHSIYDFSNTTTEESLNTMLEEAFAERCAKDSLLANSKLGEPILNNNFTISADSITYLYNPYEIASYNIGNVQLSLSKKAVMPYLNTNSVLYQYWKTK